MGFLGLFSLKLFDPKSFEKELTSLTQSISTTRTQVTALGKKRKTVRTSILLYTVLAYVLWVVYRYKAALDALGVLAHGKGRVAVFISGQGTRETIHLIAIPVAIVALLYVLDAGFSFLINSKNKSLKDLLQKHKTKIEELKTITNFNTTSELLTKYDKPTAPTAPSQPKAAAKQDPAPLQKQEAKIPQTANRPTPQAPRNPAPSVPPQPVQRTMQDRVLDFIIGSDNNESVESRYALICANCYTHNGLAPPGNADPLSVTYICRQCGFINGQFEESLPLSKNENLVEITSEAKSTAVAKAERGKCTQTNNSHSNDCRAASLCGCGQRYLGAKAGNDDNRQKCLLLTR